LFPVDGGDNKQLTYKFVDVANSSKYTFEIGKHSPVEKLGTYQYIKLPSNAKLEASIFLEVKD